MTKNRFFHRRTPQHLADNNARWTNDKDKFYKPRPILDFVGKRMLNLPLEETLSIDEPFKGKLSIKQYIKNKPYSWGSTIFSLCGKSGMPYDSVAYQSAATEINNDVVKSVEFSAAIVVHLVNRILKDAFGFKLYFENFFN